MYRTAEQWTGVTFPETVQAQGSWASPLEVYGHVSLHLVSENYVSEQSLFLSKSSHPTKFKRTTNQAIIIKHLPGQQWKYACLCLPGDLLKRTIQSSRPAHPSSCRVSCQLNSALYNKASFPPCKTQCPTSAVVMHTPPDHNTGKSRSLPLSPLCHL